MAYDVISCQKVAENTQILKISIFHELLLLLAKKLPACCGLNFDATNLPNSSFEPLYPKLFRGNPEVDLVSTVWPPGPPKVR